MVCAVTGAAQICAWVSNGAPAQNSTVTAYGRLLLGGTGQASQPMIATWNYKTTSSTCEGLTDALGGANCSRKIGRVTLGYRVDVVVTINGYSATTFFVPG